MRPGLIAVLIVAALLALGCGCTTSERPPTPTPSAATSWSFVVAGDSRAATSDSTTGVSPRLAEIAAEIAAERPAFVVFSGDLISGWDIDDDSPVHHRYRAQFDNWMAAMAPVHDYANGTGIPVYVVRGNHEDGAKKPVGELRDAYLATVGREMPDNGPPNETRLTYAFSYGGAQFIVLDQYVAADGDDGIANETWLGEQLNRTPGTIRFVFGHIPAYSVSEEEEDLSDRAAARDRFWEILRSHCVTAYLCGHDHLYARGEVLGVPQLIVGIGGAPPAAFDPSAVDPALLVAYPSRAVPADDQPAGFLRVVIDPPNGTVQGTERVMDPATGRWRDGDTFVLPVARGCPG